MKIFLQDGYVKAKAKNILKKALVVFLVAELSPWFHKHVVQSIC